MEVVSGAGAKGTSRMTLSGGKGLGPEGAQRLAELLRKAPPPMLEAMDLRCPIYPNPTCSSCIPSHYPPCTSTAIPTHHYPTCQKKGTYGNIFIFRQFLNWGNQGLGTWQPIQIILIILLLLLIIIIIMVLKKSMKVIIIL